MTFYLQAFQMIRLLGWSKAARSTGAVRHSKPIDVHMGGGFLSITDANGERLATCLEKISPLVALKVHRSPETVSARMHRRK